MKPFSGSYTPDEVRFLLKPIEIEHTPVHAKEALIQSGQKHYSEMLSHESLPSDDYLALFYQAMASNQDLMAKQLIQLTERIISTRSEGITLVSMARAGTPIGVLLKKILENHYRREVSHYSVSIIRDIGLDANALRFILSRHSVQSLVFIDGWTGKGVIAGQLAKSLQDFAISDGVSIPAELYVLADLCGYASVAASSEDYLIPSCILNATISGLISRSIYNTKDFKEDDFHGCVYYRQFEPQDLSRYFIDTILARVDSLWHTCHGQPYREPDHQQLQAISRQFLLWIEQQYGISRHSLIKPGIGESTRVLLRREAQRLLLRDKDGPATRHLRWLAESKSIPISVSKDLPYQAAALIKEISL